MRLPLMSKMVRRYLAGLKLKIRVWLRLFCPRRLPLTRPTRCFGVKLKSRSKQQEKLRKFSSYIFQNIGHNICPLDAAQLGLQGQ